MVRYLKLNNLIICVIGLFCSLHSVSDTTTSTLSVKANIIPVCQIGTGAVGSTSFGTLNFGTVTNFKQAVNVVGSDAISIKCSKNTAYKIAIDAGLHGSSANDRQLSNGSAKISYNLYQDAAHTMLWEDNDSYADVGNGLLQKLPIFGFIPQQEVTEAGVFTDQVNITISY